MVKRLLEYGANINAQDNGGKTPLFSLLKGSQSDGVSGVSSLLQVRQWSPFHRTRKLRSSFSRFSFCLTLGPMRR